MKKLKLLATLSLFFFLGSVCLVAQTAQKTVVQKQKMVAPMKVDRTVIAQKIQKLNTQEEELLQQPMTDEIADRLEQIQKNRATLNSMVEVKVNKERTESVLNNAVYEKAEEINQDLENRGINYKAIVQNIGGKQYIELVNRNPSTSYTISKKNESK